MKLFKYFKLEIIALAILLVAVMVMVFPRFFLRDDQRPIILYTHQVVKILNLAETLSQHHQRSIYINVDIDDYGRGCMILSDRAEECECDLKSKCSVGGHQYYINLPSLHSRLAILIKGNQLESFKLPNTTQSDELMTIYYDNGQILIFQSPNGDVGACSETMGAFVSCGYTSINKRV